MNVIEAPVFEIELAPTSKIDQVDFDHLKFGNIFTDHMLVCDFKDGQWQNPKIVPYGPMTFDPSTRVFHYGQAIFEGMKAYRAEDDRIWMFRPTENHARFNKSAVRLCMPEIPESIFIGGLKKLIEIDQAWAKSGQGNALYIRPFMIGTGTGVVASPSEEYRFCVILSPAKAYFSGEVKVVIADYYSRAANGGIGAAKAAGNYSGQFYPTRLAQEKGFQQVIWTDDTTHTKLEEAGTMNVFFVVNNTLLTAPASDRILDGVTRKSLIQLAQDKGYNVEVRDVFVNEIVEAAQKGTLQEVFGAGTAAVISPITSFSYQDVEYMIPTVGGEGSVANDLKTALNAIQYKLVEDPYGWTMPIQ